MKVVKGNIFECRKCFKNCIVRLKEEGLLGWYIDIMDVSKGLRKKKKQKEDCRAIHQNYVFEIPIERLLEL